MALRHPRPPQGGADPERGDRLQPVRPINNREAPSILENMREATAAAVRANVSFYTVDPRGLGGLSGEMMEIQPVFDDDPALGLDPQGLDSDLRILPGQPARAGRRDLRPGRRQHQRLRERVRAHGQGQQRVLRPRVLPAGPAQGRPVPQARGQGVAAGPAGPRARRLLDAAKAPKPPTVAGRDTPGRAGRAAGQPAAAARAAHGDPGRGFAGAAARPRCVVTVEVGGRGLQVHREGRRLPRRARAVDVAVDAAGKATGANQKVHST